MRRSTRQLTRHLIAKIYEYAAIYRSISIYMIMSKAYLDISLIYILCILYV